MRELLAAIDGLSSAELDELPFGAIQLDRDGTILQFNEYEANLSNRRAPETVGRNFFRDVAPCTNVREFYGVFRDGVAQGALNVTFDYRFAFKPAPRNVRVTLFFSAPTRVQRFFGAFQAGVERRELNEVFDFTFRFPTGARDVRIRMIYSGSAVWIFVTPIAG